MDFAQHPHQQTDINGVASFSVAKQATQIQTNSISPKTDGHCFLGPSYEVEGRLGTKVSAINK